MKKMNGNMNEVLTDGRYVYRSLNEFTPVICDFLNHLNENGFKHSPKCIGVSESKFILEFLKGEEMDLDTIVDKEQHFDLLENLAQIINQFHLIGSTFEWSKYEYFLTYEGDLDIETICHNDIAPYNMIVDNSTIVGLIDFDTICPGPRIWDIVYAAYRFIKLGKARMSYQNSMTENELKSLRLEQVRQFCQSTNIDYSIDFFVVLVERIESLCKLFDTEIEKGNEVFIKMKNEGHYDFYIDEIAYIKALYQI